jgi:hypothetical protein
MEIKAIKGEGSHSKSLFAPVYFLTSCFIYWCKTAENNKIKKGGQNTRTKGSDEVQVGVCTYPNMNSCGTLLIDVNDC